MRGLLNNESYAISADGAFMAFVSTSTNLVPGQTDANGDYDIFLYERATGTVTLISHVPGSPTTTGNAVTGAAVISADGSYVAFSSWASNLVSGQTDTNGLPDVFLFERATGAVTLVSHTPGSTTSTANGASYAPSIDSDGSVVAFLSSATDLVSGQVDTNGGADVFLFDRTTRAATLVSHTPGAATTTGNLFATPFGVGPSSPGVSFHGAYVSFELSSSNLVNGQTDTNNNLDVFLYERATGNITLVSHAAGSATTTGDSESYDNRISADGAFVTFLSRSTNLVVGQNDANALLDVFLFQRSDGASLLVSHTPGDPRKTADQTSYGVDIDPNAAFVAFTSTANNLVPNQVDLGTTEDVFLFERATGAVSLVSHAPAQSNVALRMSWFPSISADGQFVAFEMFTVDTHPVSRQVLLFHRPTGVVSIVSHAPGSATTPASGDSERPEISDDAKVVAFRSWNPALVPGQIDSNDSFDLFAWQRVGDAMDAPPGDFDGDGRTDVSVFRPSGSLWFIQGGPSANFGTDGDIPVPGDYDGDGDTDIAAFRPSSGYWFVDGGPIRQLGTSGDIPVPGDYDGDGDDDFAVFRVSGPNGFWIVDGQPVANWGASGDIPVPADYDGDGDDDFAVYRPSIGVWFVNGGIGSAWGTSEDIPVPGDYDGDGDDEFAVYRPSIGVWLVKGGTTAQFGTSGDIPIPGDYDGDGDDEFAVFRPSGGFWFAQGGPTTHFGTSGDVPLPLPDAIRRSFFTPL